MLRIGSQCSHPSCREVDFLPILCNCSLYFCRHHSSADAHACTYDRSIEQLPSSSKLQRCAADGCTKPSLDSFVASDAAGRIPAACAHCQVSFCADHRHPKSHSCRVEPSSAPKNEAARALLAKNFPSTSQTQAGAAPVHRPAKVPTDPVKRAQFQKMELMKMRQRALPADLTDKPSAVSPNDRVHVKVVCADNTEKVFWVRKTLGTGRVLDLLSSRLGMSSDYLPLQLFKVSVDNHEDRTTCRNDQLFITEVQDGSTVVIAHCI
ncbi:hypothetical protein B0H10DRAFT_2054953 [Mycena sp. CBHHK59/15]|nr:hypothetical protein B0H10DRAFT_2054953 [Mycena sp. CBHHK59/15]